MTNGYGIFPFASCFCVSSFCLGSSRFAFLYCELLQYFAKIHFLSSICQCCFLALLSILLLCLLDQSAEYAHVKYHAISCGPAKTVLIFGVGMKNYIERIYQFIQEIILVENCLLVRETNLIFMPVLPCFCFMQALLFIAVSFFSFSSPFVFALRLLFSTSFLFQITMLGRLNGAIFAVLMLVSSFFGAVFLLFPHLFLAKFYPRAWRLLADRVVGLWLTFPAALLEKLFGCRFYVTGDIIKARHPAIILMNHRTRFVFFIVFFICVSD